MTLLTVGPLVVINAHLAQVPLVHACSLLLGHLGRRSGVILDGRLFNVQSCQQEVIEKLEVNVVFLL